MIRRWLTKRRRGAMAMVAVVGMMPVTSMFAANINTSQIIEDRRHVQDAADALAKTHGVWTARALNVISMNNVTTTQLLTVAVGSEALDTTLFELMALAGTQVALTTAHGTRECAPRFNFWPADAAWGAFCGGYHGLAVAPAATAIVRAINIRRTFAPEHGAEIARKALTAIEGMNKELIARHPRAMREIAEDYSTFLGINDHHFADPCGSRLNRNCASTNSRDGMALPLEQGGFIERIERCEAMDRGTTGISTPLGTIGLHTTFKERGFQSGQGPLMYGGSRTKPVVKDHINQITDIGVILEEYDRFYKSGLAHLPRHPLSGPRITPAGNTFVPPGQQLYFDFQIGIMRVLRFAPFSFDPNPNRLQYRTNQQRNGPNDFIAQFDFKLFTICPHKPPRNFPMLPLPLFAPDPTLWKLPGVDPFGRVMDRTPDDMDDEFRILAYALKDPAKQLDMMIPYLAGQVTPGDIADQTAYAQVGVYNPDGASLYSQSWRARLMPATRMDDVSDAALNLVRDGPASFDDLASILRGVSDQSTWGRVHAH